MAQPVTIRFAQPPGPMTAMACVHDAGSAPRAKDDFLPLASACPARTSLGHVQGPPCGFGLKRRLRQLTAPSATLIVAMIASPSVTERSELRKPVPKNLRRIQASARSSNAITASARSTADR
jgi:hypothetical protein